MQKLITALIIKGPEKLIKSAGENVRVTSNKHRTAVNPPENLVNPLG